MKKMMKLAVLMATLLLLTGVAYADCSECYQVTVQDLDDPTNTHSGCITIDYCSNEIMSPFGTDIVFFFDSMNEQALIYDDEDPSCVGYIKFHGDNQFIMNGIGYCEGERHNIKGTQVECCTPGCPC